MRINNRRAKYDYYLGDKIVAGIVLGAVEVISIRNQRVSIKDSFVDIKDGEAWLRNLQIFKLKDQVLKEQKNSSYKLLLTKAQIKKLTSVLSSSNTTIVPLSLLITSKYIKVEIASAVGKKKTDKREVLKKKESQLAINRQLKKKQAYKKDKF